jgi:hypothetical protein
MNKIYIKNDITYLLYEDSKTATVSGYLCKPNPRVKDIVIPKHVVCNGTVYTVTKVDVCAFGSFSNLEHITFPDSLKDINEGVLFGCLFVTSVSVPESLAHLSEKIFEHKPLRFIRFYSRKRVISSNILINTNRIQNRFCSTGPHNDKPVLRPHSEKFWLTESIMKKYIYNHGYYKTIIARQKWLEDIHCGNDAIMHMVCYDSRSLHCGNNFWAVSKQ